MGNRQKTHPRAEKRTEAGLSAMDHQRRFLSGSHRMSVAEFARRFSEMENRLQRVLAVAKRRRVAKNP